MTEEILNKIICSNIKRYRTKETNLRQEDLARKAGVSRSSIAAIEGKRSYNVSMYKLYKIARALNVSIEDLIK